MNKSQGGDLLFIVRRALPADAQALTGLRDAFWRDQIAKGTLDNPDLVYARLSADTEKLVERARTVLLVADQGGTIGGYLYAQVKIVPGTPPVGSIEEIFVTPESRRARFAHTLVERAVAELQAHCRPDSVRIGRGAAQLDSHPGPAGFVAIQMRGPGVLRNDQVEAAVTRAPADTRAWFRGECMRRYPSQVAAASWDSVVFDIPGRHALQRVPTMDPLRGTRAHVGGLLDSCATAAELVDALAG